MRILGLDSKKGILKVKPEDREDLWLLSLLLREGDIVEGTVSRRVKREGERGSGRVFTFRVTLSVEDVEFSGTALRIRGRILEGPEDLVGRGRYQSLEVRAGDALTLRREDLGDIVEELRKAEKESRLPPVLILSVDDESATLGTYDRRLRTLTEIRRGDEELKEFFGRVLRALSERPEEIVVVGGPRVILESFRDFTEEKKVEKVVHFVVSPLGGEKGLRDIVSKRAPFLIQSERARKVAENIEEFLLHLSKEDGRASLNPERDAEMGNLKVLLVHEDWIREHKREAHALMKRARDVGAKVYVVTRDMEGEATVRKLGGRLGIRRYNA